MSYHLIVQIILGFPLVAACWEGAAQEPTDWPAILQEMVQSSDHPDFTRICGGASNVNFALRRGDKGYFIRTAPPQLDHLFADIEIEQQVLQSLQGLDVVPELIHYDRERRMLVSALIEHDGRPILLRDERTRKGVMAQLKQIESARMQIERSFLPHTHISTMLEFVKRSELPVLDPQIERTALPVLRRMESVLQRQTRRCLCHLDLHNKNILRAGNRFWFVDWEYAMMGHPYLVLASMASIERWSDAEMEQLARDYDENPSQQDLDLLLVQRVAIDLFWGVWNHIQAYTSELDNPYDEWGRLFLQAAMERIRQGGLEEALCRLESSGQ